MRNRLGRATTLLLTALLVACDAPSTGPRTSGGADVDAIFLPATAAEIALVEAEWSHWKVASLKRIAAQMIATLIIQRAMRALAGPTNTAGDLLGAVVWDTPRFASGGLVTGPGAGTSDSIPARLSDGEYVIRKAAVDQYGVNLFEALNGLRAPRIRSARQVQRFADGGLVRTPAAAGGGSSDSTLAVGLEDGLVLREMESTGGQRVLISAISKNRRAIRRALGVG